MAGNDCSSACAIAFLAGGDTQGTDVTRQVARGIEPGASLRFHSPRLGAIGQAAQLEIFRLPAYERAMQTAADLFALSRRSERGVRTLSDFIVWKILGTAYEDWYTIETVGDAVLAGIDILVPLNLKINSEAQILNVCDNFHAANPWPQLYINFGGTANEHYKQTAGMRLSSSTNKYPRFLEEKKSEQWNGDKTLVFLGASYESASKYGVVDCIVEIEKRGPDYKTNHYGDPLYTSHRQTRISAGLFFRHHTSERADREENSLTEVPIWYTYSPDLKINEIN